MEYEERNLRELGTHYIIHLSAMTSERLESKSAIAAELAYKDMIIDKLRKELIKILK